MYLGDKRYPRGLGQAKDWFRHDRRSNTQELAVFNGCLNRGQFPISWNIVDVRRFYKRGEKNKDKQLAKSYTDVYMSLLYHE